eukprot:COSAG01_NODE_29472_length_636_cov_2.830540_1_plen_38_part_10
MCLDLIVAHGDPAHVMAVLARLAHLHTPQPRRAFTVSS